MKNTYIWTKAKYTESGIKEMVRIVYNPYDRPAGEILREWVLPVYQQQCYARNHKI